MDPQTGEILSLASNPSFDSNIFSRNLTTEQFNEIVASPDVSFYNRAIAGEYSLGSTIKPIIGVDALEEGIIIPDTAKEKPLKGEVIAVGNGTKDEEMVLKVGDTVLYGKYAGTELEVEGTKYLIMRQSDVLAVLG